MSRSISVIVVSYNTRDSLRACLESLNDAPVTEIIVVDNASRDGSPEMVERDFPQVKLIRNARNRGFGAANNQGLAIMQGELALLLNSDAIAGPGSIEKLALHFEDSDVVAAGGRLQHPDGSLQESACSGLTLWAVFCEQTLLEKFFSRSRILSPYWQSGRIAARGEPAEVEQVMGACLMMRPVERFDERYFLYCEDTELCIRLRQHGRIIYDPTAPFPHELGASSSDNRGWSVAMYNVGKERTFEIHQGRTARLICFLIDRLGAVIRLLAYGLLFRKSRIAMWWHVLTAPWDGPTLPADAQRSAPAD